MKKRMYAQCPYCQTLFRVTAAHLNISQGYVRCGHCEHIFNSTTHLINDATITTKRRPNQKATDKELEVDAAADKDVPELLREDIYTPAKYISRLSSILLWGLMALLLMALLSSQYFWFAKRDWVLQHPQVRPWLESLCYNLLCALPATRNLKAFQINERLVQVHPEIENAVQIQANFVNQANFIQPYPQILITFEDVDGQPVRQRLFSATEYLGKDHTGMIAANGVVHFKLELVDMGDMIEGNDIVHGYNFEFF